MSGPSRRQFLRAGLGASGALVLGRRAGLAASTEGSAVLREDEPYAPVGTRPYEMDWAGRFQPAYRALVDFEDLSGWRVRCHDGAVAAGYRSREERLFGEHTAKVVYTGISETSRFVLEPPTPLPIPAPFDAADLWVRGNNWGWMSPPETARTTVSLLLADDQGRRVRLEMGVNNFDYWFLFHASLEKADGTRRYAPVDGDGDGDPVGPPVFFLGIEVSGCWNAEPARLFFDALSFYEERRRPLHFEPIPEHNPWPTTPDTILPTVREDSGPDPQFVYTPGDGTLGDLTVTLDGRTFQPCLKGGVRFVVNGRVVLAGHPEFRPAFLGKRRDGSRCFYDWKLRLDGITLSYSFGIEVKGKSCIIDVKVDGGSAVQFDIGLAKGLPGMKTVKVPYLAYSWDGWPLLLCGEGATGPIFVLGLMDHYNSDASEFFGHVDLTADGAVGYTGGARYHPTTAGVRNPLRERVFINVSTDFQEVLPNIPNPDCDTAETVRKCLCNNLGGKCYPFPYEELRRYKAYGIDHYIVNHHENLWRRGGESFTLRDRPAPEIGEEELARYGAFVRSLGYHFGLYQNFSDIAPVNAAWSEDLVCREPDGAWKLAWPRNYALKPLKAAELQAVYAQRVHERYGTSASCIDVHTALTPWERTDYDARTPGAGKFRTQFDAYARLLINESKVHGGPAISEGNYHWFYAGIADGNYATIQPFGSGHETAPLVDFDLLKMHMKMTDLGMGSPFCFYGYEGEWTTGPPRSAESLDRFVTATIAYGHIGYLGEPWGFDGMLKCYYLLQALQQRYVTVPVADIAYFDGESLVDSSAAIATDAYIRAQVRVRYENGLAVWCNLSRTDDWTVTLDGKVFVLPPASFLAQRPDDIVAYSAFAGGQRHELVACGDYLYLDSRDVPVRTPVLCGCGAVAVKPDGPGRWWVIPAVEVRDVEIALHWLRAGPGAGFQAIACDGAGAAVASVAAESRNGFLAIDTAPRANVVKYRLTLL